MRNYDKLFINGGWVSPSSGQVSPVHSPTTEIQIGSIPDATEADIHRAVDAAQDAFVLGGWPQVSPAERAAFLVAIAEGITRRADELAQVLAEEAGLPIATFARPEPAVGMLRYYAGLADTYPFEELRTGHSAEVLVRREAVGVVGAILPWNSPMAIGFMKLAPLLLAGCTCVFKPDPLTPLHSFLLAEILIEAGLPPGVVNIVPAGGAASEALVRHSGIDKISFTGSTATGRRIAEICATDFKRVTLELGGKSAAIVLDDADLATAIPGLIGISMMNNGEACVLQSRILVDRTRYDEVAEAMAAGVAALTVGDPCDTATFVGPLITESHRERVESDIAGSLHDGATILTGGSRPADLDRGWFTAPTVVGNAHNQMRLAREEVFGPVTALIPYDGDDEAVAIANDSPYGLSGTVWTGDDERGLQIARQVRTGNFGINTFGMDDVAPFGGFKQSGVGREKGPEGLEGFLELKSLHLPPGFVLPA